MIIFGTTTIRSTAHTGAFNCPRCSTQREYRLRRANRFFTLYFIPVIPMGSAGEWIECASCGGTFSQEVLHYDPEAERAELMQNVRRVLVLAMLDAGATSSTHVEALRLICEEKLGMLVPDEQIYEDVRLAQEANADLVAFVRHSLGDVSDRGKLLIMQLAAELLAADGTLDEYRKSILRRLGQALSMHTQFIEASISNVHGHLEQ